MRSHPFPLSVCLLGGLIAAGAAAAAVGNPAGAYPLALALALLAALWTRAAAHMAKLEKGMREAEDSADQQKMDREATIEAFEKRMQAWMQTLLASSQQLRHMSETMTQNANAATSRAQSLSAESQTTTQSVQTVATAFEQISASTRSISDRVAQSSHIVRETVAEMDKADRVSQLLAQANGKIESIVQLIQAIAGQINLLALNATIEAARAGVAGKGFSVVASEVKNLASQTSKATDEIAEQIRHIQTVSQQVIQAFHAAKETIGKINEFSSTIAGAVSEQKAATQAMANPMSSAASGASHIALHIGDMTRSSAEADAAARQVCDAATVFTEETKRMEQEMQQFVSNLRTAHG